MAVLGTEEAFWPPNIFLVFLAKFPPILSFFNSMKVGKVTNIHIIFFKKPHAPIIPLSTQTLIFLWEDKIIFFELLSKRFSNVNFE